MCLPSFGKLRAKTAGFAALVAYAFLAVAVGDAAAKVERRISTGVHVPAIGSSGMSAVDSLEKAFGHRFSIVHLYVQWSSAGDHALADAVGLVPASRTPLVTWEPWRPPADYTPVAGLSEVLREYRLEGISAGAFDAYIRANARSLAALRRIVYLRPMHEMNGTWYPWSVGSNGDTSGAYRQAWRHLRRIFAEERATNVRWVFSVNAEDVPHTNRFETYYPGGRHVDVLAIDGYNWGAASASSGEWRSFDTIFGDAYRRLVKLGAKPVWLTEIASATQGGDKAAWIRDAFAQLRTRRYARVAAVVWFNAEKERDWRLESSRESLRAFAAEVRG
jgi:beta-mannanase